MALLVVRYLLRQLGHEMGTLGTRADKTHFATKDIPELRYLINTNLPNNATHARSSFISLARPHRSFLLSVDSHRAKLCQHERASVFADSFLPVKNRPPRIDLDYDRRQQDDRQ